MVAYRVNTLGRHAGIIVLSAISLASFASARDGIDVGRRANGQLAAHIEVPQPFPLPTSQLPEFEGYATGELGFAAVIFDDLDEDLYMLDKGSDLRFELVSVQSGLRLYYGLTPMVPGQMAYLGPPVFDIHPVYNIPHGSPGTVRSLVVKLHDVNGIHADSDPITLTFVATPACPGDIDGDQGVGLSDIAAIIQCWGEEDHCNHAADQDGSHEIGLGDIAVVVQNWGASCE
ncbi:MAG TPA: hypothetical protein VG797_05705 [Phycisphaerales bacterium]|nr:hypothetical protein [Phycisphaerales bacterium]